jgi:hypothetical protein
VKTFDIERRWVRVLILFALLAAPVLRLVLYHDYGFFHTEVFAAILLMLAIAAVLAEIGRWPIVFHAEVAGLIILLSVNAVKINFFPDLRLRWILLGLGSVLAGGLLILRSKFYTVMLVFLAGAFATDVAKAIADRPPQPRHIAHVQAANRYHHVIHIIFDEMIGLSGFPPDCRSCMEARDMLQRILTRGNFRTYPNAFSNYPYTRESVSSTMNDRLLTRTMQYFPKTDPKPYLHEDKTFSRYLKEGYAVRAYQSDYIVFAAPEFPTVVARTYKANGLKNLHRLPTSWLMRLRQLGTVYLQTDNTWWDAWVTFLPASWQPQRSAHLAPLASQDIWPEPLLEDCRSATQNTYFFAHVILPHVPYVYRSDGSIRMPDDWPAPTRWVFYENEAAEYHRRYELYGQQVQFVARELEGFLNGLRDAGLYDSSTIIIHGDHGSRLRLVNKSEHLEFHDTPQCLGVNRYDYTKEPALRDLLNRFSTLLAIKPAGASAPEVVAEKGSVLYFLRRASGATVDPSEYDALNSVYLFEENGTPHAIPMLKFWQPDRAAD